MKEEVTKQLTDIEYITFSDAHDIMKIHEDNSHLMVYGNIDEGDFRDAEMGQQTQSLFVMSALIGIDDFDTYLKKGTYYNYPFAELGNPSIWTNESDEVEFTLGQQRDGNDITANYFVRRYQPHGLGKLTFPIVQSFIYYHELYEDRRKYKRLYIDGVEDSEVIREEIHPTDDNHNRVIVNLHYLREYLAARKMGLALWTSVIRYGVLDEDFEIPDKIEEENYQIHVRKADWMPKSKNVYFSELVFKTLILPYDDISWSSKNWSHRTEEDERVPMIIGVDKKSGKTIESTNSTEFLKPVYFRKEVLGKYINDERSSVDTASEGLGGIKYGDQWSITYGLNKMSRIMVWLGDLEKLPLNEQYYWRHFNIKPEGGIARDFYKTQIESEWIDSKSLEKRLLEIKNELNEVFKSRYGTVIFSDNYDDDDNIKQLHTAISKGPKALKPQILALAQLFIDSVDKDSLLKALAKEKVAIDSDIKKLGTISLLQLLCDKVSKFQLETTDTLQLIWKIRSIFIHKFNEKAYSTKINTYNSRLDPKDPDSIYPFVLTQLTIQLSDIVSIIKHA